MLLRYRDWRLDYWMQRAIIGIGIEIECMQGTRLALALTLDMADANIIDSDTSKIHQIS